MTKPASELLAEAMHLPDTDRGDLAAKLIDSLDPQSEADVEQAWCEEIRRRIEDIRTGQIQSIPWSEARKMILDDADGEPD